MSRVLIEIRVQGGEIGLIVPDLESDRMDWREYLVPLAELLADKRDAEWTATPIADDVGDREAMGVK